VNEWLPSPETATRVFLRPIANPFALGFLALAGASVTLSGAELGWIPAAQARQAALVVVLFAPLLQTISCVFGFLGRDAVAATGMGVLAGTWAVTGAVMLASPHAPSVALGTFLFLAGTAVLLSAAVAAQTKGVPASVMAVTAVRFYLSASYHVSGSAAVEHAAGYTGLVVCAVAVYGAVALEIEDIRRRTVLPTLRHGRGRAAMRAGLREQVEKIGNEAGVREQL